MDKEIQKRYKSLLTRSFNFDLGLFLFQCFLEDQSGEQIDPDQYSNFLPTPELIKNYIAIHQLSRASDPIYGTGLAVGLFDIYIEDKLRNKAIINNLLNLYGSRFMSEADFEEFHKEEVKECVYCGITEESIEKLIKHHNIFTKRLSTRGRTLEIDRMDPHLTYTKGNIAFCCYWCNNAKTDEFNFEEFKPIGAQFRRLWEARLNMNIL